MTFGSLLEIILHLPVCRERTLLSKRLFGVLTISADRDETSCRVDEMDRLNLGQNFLVKKENEGKKKTKISIFNL
uniref:Uncharacterized protein n=1 Tax=Anguilla anguilla TaxID=7936 RepID=A0A0E9V8S3_ANGAN